MPRLLLLDGVQVSAAFYFGDMSPHLVNLELLTKVSSRDTGPAAERYLERHPGAADLAKPARWPHGVYWLAAPLCARLGPLSIWTTQLVNLLFLLILIAGVALLGREVTGDLRLGLWAALLTALCPALLASSWYFSLDFPLVAMCVVGLWLLARSRGLTRWAPTLALGVWSALGMYVKLTYSLYLAAPALAAMVGGLGRGAPWGVLARAMAGVGLCLGLTVALQGDSLALVWGELTSHFGGPPFEGFAYELPQPFTLPWLLAVATFTASSYPWPLLLLALPGLVWAVGLRGRMTHRALLLACLGGTYLVMTLLANKMERYVQPLYPLLCLVTVWGLATLLPRRLRTPALALTAAAYAATAVVTHHHPTPWFYSANQEQKTGWMYELRPPGAERLARLRARELHPDLDLRALARATRQVLEGQDPTAPLAVSVRWGGPVPLLQGQRAELNNLLFLMVAQQSRARLVIHEDLDLDRFANGEPPLPPHLTGAPLVLAFHRPGRGPERRQPQLKLLARGGAVISNDDERVEVTASLLRGAQ